MAIKIALAGNPNSGKTTLFNALTGSNQSVGNWPGVTVEKKEGKLKNHKDVTIIDLPGIYSLSPYSLEEVVARNYLIDERPDVLLNIVDGTNLERNLYLTTQLLELGIPMIVAVNMMDIVAKNNDKVNLAALSKELGCEVYAISALRSEGLMEAAGAAVALGSVKKAIPVRRYSGGVEHVIAHIEEALLHDMPEAQQRWYAVKLFERDEKIIEKLRVDQKTLAHINDDIKRCEEEMDDDSESIITAERYTYIDGVIKKCFSGRNRNKLSTSDKVDRIVTNRFLALPIFAAVMFIVYYIAVSTVGTVVTDWANDGVFGDGWHLFGNGASAYEEVVSEFEVEQAKIDAFLEAAEAEGISVSDVSAALEAEEMDEGIIESFAVAASSITAEAVIEDKEAGTKEVIPVNAAAFLAAVDFPEPDPADFGIWVLGVPVILGDALEAADTAPWLHSLVIDGIVAGVGAVLGFVPQMLVLFIFLAFLEGCGYMARVAFIMDRIFRRFGLSGKSFIPMLISTGCGVPGIMATRTIESDRDRKMTMITTIFVPCGAKLPIIALIAGALFGGAPWVAPSAYFIGVGAIIVSGIILKKTKMFTGDVSPFVMELPAYHLPTIVYVLRSMWERGWSFIKKAGTIILLAAIFIWFTSTFGFADGKFSMVDDMDSSILAWIGNAFAWVFIPLGFGNWQAAVATIMGLVAKESVVSTFGVLYGFAEVSEDGVEIWTHLAASFTVVSAYAFLVFNLLCAPCFAALGAIRREMNNAKWFWFAVSYQTGFAYAVALCIYQFGTLFTTGVFGLGTIFAIAVLAGLIYLMVRRPKRENQLKVKERDKAMV